MGRGSAGRASLRVGPASQTLEYTYMIRVISSPSIYASRSEASLVSTPSQKRAAAESDAGEWRRAKGEGDSDNAGSPRRRRGARLTSTTGFWTLIRCSGLTCMSVCGVYGGVGKGKRVSRRVGRETCAPVEPPSRPAARTPAFPAVKPLSTL